MTTSIWWEDGRDMQTPGLLIWYSHIDGDNKEGRNLTTLIEDGNMGKPYNQEYHMYLKISRRVL